MSQSEKPFTVSDRRHFTADGRPRDDEDAAKAAESTPDQPPPAESETAPADHSGAPRAAPSGPADLGQFLLSLGAQASLLLSGAGLPKDADPAQALEGVRSIISILEMLEQKTAGHRTGEEDAILADLLFGLRMAYVEKTRAGAS